MKIGKRKELGEFLKKLIKRNDIKVPQLATALDCTGSFIYAILSGSNQLVDDKYDALINYLEKNNIDSDDINRLSLLWINAQSGVDITSVMDRESASVSVLKNHYWSLFDQLKIEQRERVLSLMLQYIEDNRNEMARLAGLDSCEKRKE